MSERLSKRLKPLDLSRMAADDEHWDDLEEIADHPSAWPALQEWIDHALEAGPLLAGEPPEPPAGWKRGMNKRPPKYHTPASTRDPEPKPVPVEPARTPVEQGHLIPVMSAEPDPEEASGPTADEDGADIIEKPKRTFVGLSRTRLMPIMLILVLVMTVGAACAAQSWLSSRAATERSRQETVAREHDEAVRLGKARKQARALLNKIDDSPVAADDEVRAGADALGRLLKRDGTAVNRITRGTASLSDAYDDAMEALAASTGDRLASLVKQAEALRDAPESTDRKRMLALAAAWKSRSVTSTNLGSAMKDMDELSNLVDRVGNAKDEADRKAREEREENPEPAETTTTTPSTGTTPVPQQSTPSYTPAPSSPVTPSAPAPSTTTTPTRPQWSVGPDSTDFSTGMPGRDGSL